MFVKCVRDVARLGHANSPTGRILKKAGETARTAHALLEESRAEADRIVGETKEASAKVLADAESVNEPGVWQVKARGAKVLGEATERA